MKRRRSNRGSWGQESELLELRMMSGWQMNYLREVQRDQKPEADGPGETGPCQGDRCC